MSLATVAAALLTAFVPVGRAAGSHDSEPGDAVVPSLPSLRSDRTPLPSGAELITIYGTSDTTSEFPLVAVLNDTLGDDDPTNDQLRYVWVFSYCPPSVSQRVLASIPFFYHGVSSRKPRPGSAPPVIFDFSRNPDPVWRKIAWYAMQAAVLDPHGWLFQAGSRTYTRNENEYRRAHLRNGLSILSMYRESADDVPEVLDGPDFEQVYGRIVESGLAGAFLNERHFADAYERDSSASRRDIARNWDLLRQRCEEEGLFFDPLPSPPASARHAIVWVSKDELARSPRDRAFNARFLNVKNPWTDDTLHTWSGYSKTFYESEDGRYLRDDSEGGKPVEMIPIAVYGLDFPKIPALLVDFRAIFNPKRRELSRRAVDDVGRYLLHISPFGDVKLYVAQKVYAMVTGKKGYDLNQPSRALTYAQLKSLLVLRDELDPELREMVLRDVRRMNVNPLENDVEAERKIAQVQYHALLEQIDSGELDRRIERDRDEDRARLVHGGFARAMLKTARLVTFGLVSHEDDSPELRDRYAKARSLAHYRSLLADVATAPKPIEVTWDPEKFRPALAFVASNGAPADAALVASIETIVRSSEEPSTQLLALDALSRVDGVVARRALERLQADGAVASDVRAYAARLLGDSQFAGSPGYSASPAAP